LKIKIGIGYDLHKLQRGRRLFLGGVEIPFPKGLMGHSDGDCLIHAIIDAILGAIGEKDIGQIFPDDDPQYRDVQSITLLKTAMGRVQKLNGKIHHIDCIIIAESPKIEPYSARMKQVLCPILQIGERDIGIKAKTNEGIGPIGRGKAIAAFAQALLEL
jgi:2-C-methyl-D-erythritol 2,4-cyclodiphosphate synthase